MLRDTARIISGSHFKGHFGGIASVEGLYYDGYQLFCTNPFRNFILKCKLSIVLRNYLNILFHNLKHSCHYYWDGKLVKPNMIIVTAKFVTFVFLHLVCLIDNWMDLIAFAFRDRYRLVSSVYQIGRRFWEQRFVEIVRSGRLLRAMKVLTKRQIDH